MSEELHLLIHKKTLDVLGVVSRTASGAPTVAQVAGEYMQLFDATTGAEHARIPAANLDLKAASYNHRLIANPLAYQFTDQGPLAKTGTVTVSISGGKANVGFSNVAVGTPAELWLRIEGDDLAEPFTQAAQVTGTSFPSNPGGFAPANKYRVICLVQGQVPVIDEVTAT
jgi:hypothetical protein